MKRTSPRTTSGTISADLFASETPSEPLEKPEKRCITHLLGIVSRGVFQANREELREIMLSEHEAKIEGLARHVLKMPNKLDRRAWLDKFEDKHGVEITLELKDKIIELARERQSQQS